jgi:hypothetical protein
MELTVGFSILFKEIATISDKGHWTNNYLPANGSWQAKHTKCSGCQTRPSAVMERPRIGLWHEAQVLRSNLL